MPKKTNMFTRLIGGTLVASFGALLIYAGINGIMDPPPVQEGIYGFVATGPMVVLLGILLVVIAPLIVIYWDDKPKSKHERRQQRKMERKEVPREDSKYW